MDDNQNYWNKQQKKFKAALKDSSSHKECMALFLDQHAMLHTAEISGSGLWSFADDILENLDESKIRKIPEGHEHSIAWIFWHMARIEDVTMNMLVGDLPQLFINGGWDEKTGISNCETGNAMDAGQITQLSSTIKIPGLLDYRNAVGHQTRRIVPGLQPDQLKMKIDPSRLEKIYKEGAVVESTRGMLDFWGRHTIGSLLIMPPTRHLMIHLNEATRLKKVLG